jgi:cytochrome P450 / NADPH-cytochrome P450 reductase
MRWLTNIQEYSTSVSEALESGQGIKIETIGEVTSRAVELRQRDAAIGTVVENRVLTAPGAPEKRHIGAYGDCYSLRTYLTLGAEFELPEGMTSRAGDYLAM